MYTCPMVHKHTTMHSLSISCNMPQSRVNLVSKAKGAILIYENTHTHTHTRAHTCTHTHTHTHTHIHTRTHTYTHTYTHIHTSDQQGYGLGKFKTLKLCHFRYHKHINSHPGQLQCRKDLTVPHLLFPSYRK